MSRIILSFVLSVTLFAQVSWAQMVSTETLFEQPVTVSAEQKVAQFMARQDVVNTFEQMGVDSKMVQERVAVLSDEEISKIAYQIDTLPAGGDALGGIVGAVVFIFIVLLITDILGLTKVFNFTRPVR